MAALPPLLLSPPLRSFSFIVRHCPAGIPLVLAGMLVSFFARLLYN